jgi:putative transposase
VEFIDMFRGRRESGGLMWRVEPICKVLKEQYGVSISPSGYYGFNRRPPSERAVNDVYLCVKIINAYEGNFSCYGARKIWRRLLKDGVSVARCTVERLMSKMGISGVVRGKVKTTTIAGKNARDVDDLVNRDFHATAPNNLWVADFTYVSTWEGWCYTAFITDVFARRIIGWLCQARMNEDMVAGAFRAAVHNRAREGNDDLSELIHHNDKGSQYTADDFLELLAAHGVSISIGSVGDSYDNALAESMNGLYKSELIKNRGPWKTFEQLNLWTARWVHWHNTGCISQYNNWNTPAEVEAMWYSDGIDARKGSIGQEA